MHSDPTSSLAASEAVTDIHGSRETALSSPEETRPDLGKVSTLVSRNVTIGGHRTSCRLEPYMWDALYESARASGSPSTRSARGSASARTPIRR